MSGEAGEADREQSQERAAHEAAVLMGERAREALRNEAIMAFFEEIERKAVDAILATKPTEDLERLRLVVVASTIRGLVRFLHDGVAEGDYAGRLLERINREDEAR